jgi:hypothetical protein
MQAFEGVSEAFFAGVAINRMVAITVLFHREPMVEGKIHGELGRHPSHVIIGIHQETAERKLRHFSDRMDGKFEEPRR